MVSEKEAVADAARHAMVDQLRVLGRSEATLAAFASVPRHRLVDPHPGITRLHDIDRAWPIKGSATGAPTSTASAPRLLAAQADLLELAPGMRILEIGTGPGYFAAILASIVGPSGSVVTIDIDEAVATSASARLAHLGYDNVTVVVRDGHLGAPELGPFDRVVGSVGCADVAAAWLQELDTDGAALIPLAHGALHPMLRLDARGKGRVATCSGYVAIQGAQEHVAPWPHAHAAVSLTDRRALPPVLAAALVPAPGRERLGGLAEWDLGYWVALEDLRAGAFAALNDGAGSSARIDATRGAVEWGGDHGEGLARDLVDHGGAWLTAARPTLGDFTQDFVPVSEASPVAESGRRWIVRRLDFHQVITLDR